MTKTKQFFFFFLVVVSFHIIFFLLVLFFAIDTSPWYPPSLSFVGGAGTVGFTIYYYFIFFSALSIKWSFINFPFWYPFPFLCHIVDEELGYTYLCSEICFFARIYVFNSLYVSRDYSWLVGYQCNCNLVFV